MANLNKDSQLTSEDLAETLGPMEDYLWETDTAEQRRAVLLACTSLMLRADVNMIDASLGWVKHEPILEEAIWRAALNGGNPAVIPMLVAHGWHAETGLAVAMGLNHLAKPLFHELVAHVKDKVHVTPKTLVSARYSGHWQPTTWLGLAAYQGYPDDDDGQYLLDAAWQQPLMRSQTALDEMAFGLIFRDPMMLFHKDEKAGRRVLAQMLEYLSQAGACFDLPQSVEEHAALKDEPWILGGHSENQQTPVAARYKPEKSMVTIHARGQWLKLVMGQALDQCQGLALDTFCALDWANVSPQIAQDTWTILLKPSKWSWAARRDRPLAQGVVKPKRVEGHLAEDTSFNTKTLRVPALNQLIQRLVTAGLLPPPAEMAAPPIVLASQIYWHSQEDGKPLKNNPMHTLNQLQSSSLAFARLNGHHLRGLIEGIMTQAWPKQSGGEKPVIPLLNLWTSSEFKPWVKPEDWDTWTTTVQSLKQVHDDALAKDPKNKYAAEALAIKSDHQDAYRGLVRETLMKLADLPSEQAAKPVSALRRRPRG